MQIKSSDCYPVAFNPDMRAVLAHKYTEYCEKGGRGSCKSTFISVATILLMMSNPAYNALVLRKVADTLADSVYSQLLWAIDKLGLTDDFEAKLSPLKIVRKSTGQRIVFRGADKPEKLKSIKLKNGYFAVTWFEELTEFTPEDVEKIRLSTMRGGSRFWVFYSFNPPPASRNWCNTEFMHEKKGRLVHHSDYRTTPTQWLGQAFIDEAESLRERNLRSYENIFLGIASGTGRQVFENIELREITDDEIDSWESTLQGVDWGFYPDPYAYGSMHYDAGRHTLYIWDELYLYKHGNYEAFQRTQEHMTDKGMNITTDRITADSAEPKSVADFHKWGGNTRGAIKGKGSRDAGYKWLQGLHKIVIDPARTPRAADEFTLYEHDIDRKTGEIQTGYPEGQPDHFIALTRYATEAIWRHAGT